MPPEPWVIIEIEGGCDKEYNYGDQTRLFVKTNVEGVAEVWLDDEFLEEIWLVPGEVWDTSWTLEDMQPGEHLFGVALRDESGQFLAEDGCLFALAPAPPTPMTPSPTPDTTAPPVPTPLEPGNADSAYSESVDCPVTLRWKPISDPSGVIYFVELETRMDVYSEWQPDYAWEKVSGSELEVSYPYCQTAYYRWRVIAQDGAGNWSEGWSDWLYYEIPLY